jgi:hypothetical protein
MTSYVGTDKKDIPPPLTKEELMLKKQVEDKVRLLLQRTELKEIAKTAKVVVSIARDTNIQSLNRTDRSNSAVSSEAGETIPPHTGLPFMGEASSRHSGDVSVQGRVKPIYNHSGLVRDSSYYASPIKRARESKANKDDE